MCNIMKMSSLVRYREPQSFSTTLNPGLLQFAALTLPLKTGFTSGQELILLTRHVQRFSSGFLAAQEVFLVSVHFPGSVPKRLLFLTDV